MDLLERKKIEDSIQEEFTNYKRAGSTLLQANRIDAKKYYANVRNKGIELGLLTENDYPTDLPSWAEPTMRITGATLGAIAGGVAGIAGRQNPLTSTSAGAGLGGAAATAAYRELAELLNPDLPLAPIGKKMSDVGIAGAIDFGGTMAVGGLFNGVGALLGKGKQMSQRGIQNLGNKSDEALENIAKKQIQPKIGFLQKMFTSQEKRLDGLVDQTMKEMREQGLTPYMAAMTPPIIKSYFEAAGVMPIFGRPVHALAQNQQKELVTRLVDGVKRDVSQGGDIAPLLQKDSFFIQGGKIVRGKSYDLKGNVVNSAQKENINALNGATFMRMVEKNIDDLAKQKKDLYRAYDDSVINISPVALRGTKLSKQIGLSGNKNGIFSTTFDKTSAGGTREGGNAMREATRLYMTPNRGEYILQNVQKHIDSKGRINGKGLNQLYSNVRDSLNLINSNVKKSGVAEKASDQVAIPRLAALKETIESTINNSGAKGAEAARKLLAAKTGGQQFRTAVQQNADALNVMGSQNALKILANEMPEYGIQGVRMSAVDKGRATVTDVINKYYNKPDISSQKYLKSLLDGKEGSKFGEYKALVSQEIDDLFYQNVFKSVNKGGNWKGTVTDYNKAFGLHGEGNGLMKAKIRTAFPTKQFGTKADDIINNLGKISKILDNHMVTQPNFSKYLVRNAAISGTLGFGVVGLGGAAIGGLMGTAVSMGAVYGIVNFLAKPYAKGLVNTAINQAGTRAGTTAGERITAEISELSKPAAKFNAKKEQIMARLNPELYEKFKLSLEGTRQAGIEGIAQTSGLIDRPD